ncbi:hypothetical protein GCM10007036_12490 [Alsobacter metallidurans]|uniref:Uncharacterized protein n=1 Tax=Alsobacter metallidurans TaxID=340221 RepID=A0A917MHA6_9HYPH|nr:hypothetical protein [Alsobacter metallidurans]GGH13696.1 hypothetical protein GCM10007036_12490 [Alsobacter metallidurans]
MGFVLRTVIAVGIVYAISPLRDQAGPAPDLAGAARAVVADQGGKAVSAAMQLCLKDKASCALLGLGHPADAPAAPAREVAAGPSVTGSTTRPATLANAPSAKAPAAPAQPSRKKPGAEPRTPRVD